MSENAIVDSILRPLVEFLPPKEFTALHEPLFNGNEKKYVDECIDSGWVSSVGKYVDLFEERLAAYTGVKRAIAVVNGTSALHICLLLSGVKKNDEVIVPALTFIATANAVSYCNAIPHFVDSEMSTLGMDAGVLRDYLQEISEVKNGSCYNKKTGRKISAIVPMHTFGHPVDMDKILAVAEEFCLTVIEDCAESIGSFYKGKHTGNFGKVAAMSFNGNKTITTGGGGAILTNDIELGKLAKHITTQAKIAHRWEFSHDAIGYNYRMPNINAALGCAQLECLDNFIMKKRSLANKYMEIYQDNEYIDIFKEPKFAYSNYWFNAMILKPQYAYLRDVLLEVFNNSKIMTRPIWNLMYTMPMFKDCPKMECKNAELIGKTLINIPSSVKLGGFV